LQSWITTERTLLAHSKPATPPRVETTAPAPVSPVWPRQATATAPRTVWEKAWTSAASEPVSQRCEQAASAASAVTSSATRGSRLACGAMISAYPAKVTCRRRTHDAPPSPARACCCRNSDRVTRRRSRALAQGHPAEIEAVPHMPMTITRLWLLPGMQPQHHKAAWTESVRQITTSSAKTHGRRARPAPPISRPIILQSVKVWLPGHLT
jgi:hypothetical protein